VIDLSDRSNGSCGRVDIVVTLAGGAQSVVRIGTAATESAMLDSIVGLCYVLPTTGNARKQSGDQGEMHALERKQVHLCAEVSTLSREVNQGIRICRIVALVALQ
jgi:hypothetical protein